MANVVAGLLKLIFGSKADKDRKAVIPYIEKINAVYPQIEKLTDDELRARSSALMARIADAIADDETRIASLKEELERSDISIEEKEKISTDIEHLTKNISQNQARWDSGSTYIKKAVNHEQTIAAHPGRCPGYLFGRMCQKAGS